METGADAPNVSLGEFGCAKTAADTGTKVGRRAGGARGSRGLEPLAGSFSAGLQITVLLTGTGGSLGVDAKTGAGTETARERGT